MAKLRVSTDRLRKGMLITNSVFSHAGQEILEIKPIAERKAEFTESMQVAEETLSENLIALVNQDKDINVPQLVDVMNGVLEKAVDDASIGDMLFWMKESEGSLYRHAVNVSLLGQILAKWLRFTKEEIVTFTDKITQSYIQQKVLLSNGRTGHIVLLNKYNLTRPLVRCAGGVINLANHMDIHIVEFLERE